MHAGCAYARALLDDERGDRSRNALKLLPGAPSAGLQAQG
jgi:hypothetical protein